MIRINQLKFDHSADIEEISKRCVKMLKVKDNTVNSVKIAKLSYDARKKPDIMHVYSADVQLSADINEEKLIHRLNDRNIIKCPDAPYMIPRHGNKPLRGRPVVVGAGPAGLFCAYLLACEGYAPILLERGKNVEQRRIDVDKFWETGILKPSSNVQFGEGGAGAFSDGKLNTTVKDRYGRKSKVIEVFIDAGAPEEIGYLYHPHIGTDKLRSVIANIRDQIIEKGGEVRFDSQVTGIIVNDGELSAVVINDTDIIESSQAVFAIGHSARDTFFMLHQMGLNMSAKSFACGVRIEHPQEMINLSQYGRSDMTADYKLTANLPSGRSVYSFCMCPGGFVVNASSEEQRLAVNGMSYYLRDGNNANSAIVVNVDPDDFGYDPAYPDVLQGIAFQRRLEEAAYKEGDGSVPVQTLGDFRAGKATTSLGSVEPAIKGSYKLANVRNILPKFIGDSIVEAMDSFDSKIRGYGRDDAVLSGTETRTSSPVKIFRDEECESSIKGLYPCGEGAGYAGGIMSAAMDGLRVAEAVISTFRNY